MGATGVVIRPVQRLRPSCSFPPSRLRRGTRKNASQPRLGSARALSDGAVLFPFGLPASLLSAFAFGSSTLRLPGDGFVGPLADV